MPSQDNIEKNSSLINKLASGALWVIGGMFIARFLGYFIRAIIARNFGQELYGYLATSQSLMVMISLIALMGLSTGLSRQVAYYTASGRTDDVRKNIVAAYHMGIISSISLATLFFFLSPLIARHFFNDANLIPYFRIFAVSVPFYLFLELNSSVLKGLKRMWEFSLFHDVLRFSLILFFLCTFLLFNLSFLWIASAYLISFIIIDLASFIVIQKRLPVLARLLDKTGDVGRKLYRFSLPLMFSNIFWILLFRTDVLLIGGFLSQSHVGLYSAAVPIAQLILALRQAFTPIILPLLTELIAKKQHQELSLLYFLSAKWTTLFALPVFLSMAIAPEIFIQFIFGEQYLEASSVLRIISIAYFIHTIVGPSSNMVVIIGKTGLAMFNSIIAFCLSIVLNIFLIPKFGINGAALTAVFTFLLYNLLCLSQVYRYIGVQPFRLIHIKFLIAGFLSSVFLYFLINIIPPIAALFCFFLIYFLLLFALKAFKEEDKLILNMVMRKFRR